MTNWTLDQLVRADSGHLLHPFSELGSSPSAKPRFFSAGEGAWIYDLDGRKYLDGIGGLWCVNIGYGRPEMVDTIADQVAKLPYYNTFTDMSSEPAALLAAKLGQLAPADLDQVFFTTGGSTSIDSAVRLSHFYFQAQGRASKRIVLARENAYHGSTFLGASISGIKKNHTGFHHLAHGDSRLVHHLSCPNLYRSPEGLDEEAYASQLIEELERKIEELGAENIACFIAELIMGAAGVLIPPKTYHQQAQQVCRRNDILFICDEVVTGFGRLGWMLACEDEFNTVPDIIVCAKGISSGYIPLGAMLFSRRILDGMQSGNSGIGVFSHGFTYSGHPVACAAGLKNIEIIEREALCEHVRETGPYFAESLSSLGALELVGDVRGRGFMHAIEFSSNKRTREGFGSAIGMGKRVARAAYDRGVIARNVDDLIILSPPLIMSRDQIDILTRTLGEAIQEATQELRREGLWNAEGHLND